MCETHRKNTMPRDIAVSIGVVFDRAQDGIVVRVINPDFEWELDQHHLSSTEYLIRVPKEVFGVSKDKDAMTIDQVYRVHEILNP